MDIDHASEKERYDMLAEMADLYYNQGKTQSEIAKHFETNRFRVAKLLQDARNEQIVEIHINYSNERNSVLETELKKKLSLQKAIVVNSQYTTYVDSLTQMGKVGAAYLAKVLKSGNVAGVTWGKTVYSVISQLPTVVGNPVKVVQLTGNSRMKNPAVDTRELVRQMAAAFYGEYYYLDMPIYVQDEAVRSGLYTEPLIRETLDRSKDMDLIISGIGGTSSLPLRNPELRRYLTKKDEEAAETCLGSLYGFVLDEKGQVADIDLNRKLVSAPLTDIMKTPHRLVVACGRHKTEILKKTARNGLYNELLTDSETAIHLLEE